jgi:exodeoxyribonuclease VII small subunit
MERLGEIVEQLESGDRSLDDSLRLFEEGVALSRRAGALLDQAERKIQILTRAADGSVAPVDLPEEDGGGESDPGADR